jgi:hypothetical protein
MRTEYVGGNKIVTDKEMRPRNEFDFYPTEEACIREYFKQFSPNLNPVNVLDPAAGAGVWGRVLRASYPGISYLAGVELQDIFTNDSAFIYDTWLKNTDFLALDGPWLSNTQHDPVQFDLIATNPPYKTAESFFWKCRSRVSDNGRIVFLLRLGFLASERRFTSMWTTGYAPTTVTVLNTRPSFTGDGKTYPGDFAMFEWCFKDGVCQPDSDIRFMTYAR